MTLIGHYGTGEVEFTLSSEADFEPVKAIYTNGLQQSSIEI